MPDPIKFADHAAQMTDRWLLMFVLFICFVGVIWLVKWLVGRLEKQTELLAGLFDEANKGREKVADVISANTAHIQSCTEHHRENTEVMRRCSEQLSYITRER